MEQTFSTMVSDQGNFFLPKKEHDKLLAFKNTAIHFLDKQAKDLKGF